MSSWRGCQRRETGDVKGRVEGPGGPQIAPEEGDLCAFRNILRPAASPIQGGLHATRRLGISVPAGAAEGNVGVERHVIKIYRAPAERPHNGGPELREGARGRILDAGPDHLDQTLAGEGSKGSRREL